MRKETPYIYIYTCMHNQVNSQYYGLMLCVGSVLTESICKLMFIFVRQAELSVLDTTAIYGHSEVKDTKKKLN